MFIRTDKEKRFGFLKNEAQGFVFASTQSVEISDVQ